MCYCKLTLVVLVIYYCCLRQKWNRIEEKRISSQSTFLNPLTKCIAISRRYSHRRRIKIRDQQMYAFASDSRRELNTCT